MQKAVDDVLEAAASAASVHAFRTAMARLVGAFVGADVVGVHALFPSKDDVGGAVMLNMDAVLAAAFLEDRARYYLSALPLYRALAAGRAPAIDDEIVARRDLERMALYREILAPAGVTTAMACPLEFRGECTGMIAFGRGGRGSRFLARDTRRIGRLLPFLALADTAVAARRASDALDLLGAREKQVARLIAMGLQNKEVALALGTSVHTVRNQSRRIYEKLGVSGRAHLAARLGGAVDVR